VVTLAASTTSPTTGDPVTFTVTAHSPDEVFKSVSIDFTGDGTVDEIQFFDQTSVAATFSHAYLSAGAFTVRAEVKDVNSAVVSRSLLLIVSAPAIPPVSFRLNADGSAGDSGVCGASGPPAACAGCSLTIGAAGRTGSLGAMPHGTPVSVTQAFEQESFVTGSTTTRYACGFSLDLYAGPPGNEVLFGHGACTTDSGANPERLTCGITTNGVVP